MVSFSSMSKKGKALLVEELRQGQNNVNYNEKRQEKEGNMQVGTTLGIGEIWWDCDFCVTLPVENEKMREWESCVSHSDWDAQPWSP